GTPRGPAGRQRLAGDQPPVRRPRDLPDPAGSVAARPPGYLPIGPASRGGRGPLGATPLGAGGGAEPVGPGLAAEPVGADRGGPAGAHPALGRAATRRKRRLAGEARPVPPPGRTRRPAH